MLSHAGCSCSSPACDIYCCLCRFPNPHGPSSAQSKAKKNKLSRVSAAGFSRQRLHWESEVFSTDMMADNVAALLCKGGLSVFSAYYWMCVCVRETVASASWQKDGCVIPPSTSPGLHPNKLLLGSRAPSQTDWKRLACPLANSWHVLCCLDRACLLANAFTEINESQADFATVSPSGHIRRFIKVITAVNPVTYHSSRLVMLVVFDISLNKSDAFEMRWIFRFGVHP